MVNSLLLEEMKTNRPIALTGETVKFVHADGRVTYAIICAVDSKNPSHGCIILGVLAPWDDASKCSETLPKSLQHMVRKWKPNSLVTPADIMECPNLSDVLVKEAGEDGAILVWPCEMHTAYVVPQLVVPLHSTRVVAVPDILSQFLKTQISFATNRLFSSHGGNVVDCMKYGFDWNMFGRVVGTIKSNRENPDAILKKRWPEDVPISGERPAAPLPKNASGNDKFLYESRATLSLARKLVRWFREMRHSTLLLRIALDPTTVNKQKAAREWLIENTHHSPTETQLVRSIASSGKSTKISEILIEFHRSFAKELEEASNRIILQPLTLDWGHYRVELDKLRTKLNQHALTIPFGQRVSPTCGLNWNGLLTMYSYLVTKGMGYPIAADDEPEKLILISRVMQYGHWEIALYSDESMIVLVPEAQLLEYDVIRLHPDTAWALKMQTLDEISLSKGKHYSAANKAELESDSLMFEARSGGHNVGMHFPRKLENGKYKWKAGFLRFWEHISGISKTDIKRISSWSCIFARTQGKVPDKKQHTDKCGSTFRVGVGQPSTEVGLALMYATIVDALQISGVPVEHTDPTIKALENEVFAIARQMRLFYALIGLNITNNSHYAIRKLRMGQPRDAVCAQQGAGSYQSRAAAAKRQRTGTI